MIIAIDQKGSPIIDPQGNFQYISGLQEYKQRLINVFFTFRGSDILLPQYGFDYDTFYMLSAISGVSYALRAIIMDCFRPGIVFGLDHVTNADAYISGNTGYISLSAVMKDGTSVTQEFMLGMVG